MFRWPQVPSWAWVYFLAVSVTRRVVCFIDGFNLYHALDAHERYRKYKWLDLRRLAECFVAGTERLDDVLYFTTYSTWNPDKLGRHRLYVRALESRSVKVIFGKFKKVTKRCRAECGKQFQTFEEKRTDVNIAVQLFSYAQRDLFDKALIVSGDSDLIPAIEETRRIFPNKSIGVIIPIARQAEEMKNSADFHIRMKERHLRSSLLPDPIEIGQGVRLAKPATWV